MTEKNLENMTQKERIAYWDRVRKEEEQDREDRIRQLTEEQRNVLVKMHKELNSVLLTALYNDMGGIRCLSVLELQDLEDTMNSFQRQFNLEGIT
jgi:hypothetical protein|tara:strand:- start:3434 stop:3718 length:285 start_codon:yes stop_codon:yes gene_type:complete